MWVYSNFMSYMRLSSFPSITWWRDCLFFLAPLCSLWDLSSPARDQSCALQWNHSLNPWTSGGRPEGADFSVGQLPRGGGVCRAGASEVPQGQLRPLQVVSPRATETSRRHGAGMAGMAHGASRRHFPPRKPSAASVSSPRCQGCCLRCLWGWTPSATSVHGAWLSDFPGSQCRRCPARLQLVHWGQRPEASFRSAAVSPPLTRRLLNSVLLTAALQRRSVRRALGGGLTRGQGRGWVKLGRKWSLKVRSSLIWV